MSMDPHDDLAVNCDLCGGEPACVESCPHGALIYADPSQAALIKKRAAARRISDAMEGLDAW
jgi:Fe-S-cluster-containing hydrogenase component 2